ncbi:MAG TPA: sulfite exporter TauE/SafE family protein [Flavitalea sp.]|nr:sulfite exporter TauE/SafE family protein [Flavitalea sp.]
MIELLISGLILGMISSFHCVGMCGPLALALPVSHLSRPNQVLSIVLYNSGRIITYATLGLVFGLAGRKLYLAGLQQWFSIIAGSIMLAIAIQYFIGKRPFQPSWMNGFNRMVQKLIQTSLQSKRVGRFLLLGMSNGLLPCGMVYLAVAGALSTTRVYDSVLFMTLFGIGTLPAMLLLSFLGLRADISFRQRIKRAMPLVISTVAVLLILRGMNLGIPYISPHLASNNAATVSCP